MSGAVLVVGAGFAGAVSARELADAGHAVEVIDRRPHVAGNAFDGPDAHGVLIHHYGPHIFHTNSDRIFAWLSRFTRWRPYEHRVLASVSGRLVPVPINRTTINRLYDLNLDGEGVARHLERVRVPHPDPPDSESLLLSTIGQDLCDRLFRGYSRKQWGIDLRQLDARVAGRIPVRTDDDDRYFTDRHQAMPADGYAALFARILDHPRIRVRLGVEFDPTRDGRGRRHVVYTGPVDAYFGHRFGQLPYRSLRFETEHHPGHALVQPVATINHPNEHAYTRVTEFKHMTGQQCAGTTLVREYPAAEGPPYYPVPTAASAALHRRYQDLVDATPGVSFVGRLAEYRYYNMDQVVAAALRTAARIADRLAGASPAAGQAAASATSE
ncbi:UDP-galactopyranose mutase [Stella humosa]|uniref:UDP-galactopyranose mutase n=1 Tax=Stella humosa TaxID=94 RepID=A0A3N1MBF0_9PROT|nr:UDP-galactopyranose mutase [Stella humosa]ROQ01061.1 UDP-galactopyranose mutase [Stella humosa]BBK31432.1 UDP-galactopyranose mutase [Stella humosa]